MGFGIGPMVHPAGRQGVQIYTGPMMNSGMVPPTGNGLLGAIGGALGGFATGGIGGAIGGAIGGWSGDNSSGATAAEGNNLVPGATGGGPCGPGFVWRNGRCEQTGIGGTIARIAPGGNTGLQPQGDAVLGAFGIPAMTPMVAGSSVNGRGEVNPVFRCIPGAVLGKDNLCYMKGSIPRTFRKWKPAARPVMSAADAKALRRIGTIQKKVKRLAGNAGLACTTKGRRR